MLTFHAKIWHYSETVSLQPSDDAEREPVSVAAAAGQAAQGDPPQAGEQPPQQTAGQQPAEDVDRNPGMAYSSVELF